MTRTRAAAWAVLLLLPVFLLGPSLFAREVFLPFSAANFPPFAAELDPALRQQLAAHANMDVTEVPVTFIPELEHVRGELAAGHLPHWNPYARFGASLLATSVVGLMYPPNWLTFLAVDPTVGLAWNAYLALVLAGVLMFGFLRALGLSVHVALLGAMAFAWSGTITANLHFYQRVHALVWLPGMLWALARMQQTQGRRRRRAGVGLALCVAMTWLAGFPSFAASATLVAGGWAVCLLMVEVRARGARPAGSLLLVQSSGIGLGMALAAVQLLPMFAFFPESNRDPDPTRDSIASQAFDPMGLLGYALPDAFGTPAYPALPYDHSLLAWSMFSRTSWDSGVAFRPNYNFVEYTVYPGALVLLLALVGAIAARGRGRMFAVLGLLVLWVLACAGPLTAAINDLPFVRSVPPMRFVAPACVLLALLAARGLARVYQDAWRGRLIAGLAFVGAAACFVARLVLGTRSPDAWLVQQTPVLIEHYRPRFPIVSQEIVQGMFGKHVQFAADLLRDNLTYATVALAGAGLWLVLAPLVGRTRRGAHFWSLVAIAATGIELLTFAQPINRGRPDVRPSAPALDFLRAQRAAHADDGGFTVVRGAAVADLPLALPPCLLVPERIRDLHAYTFVDARSHRLFVALYGPDHMLRAYWPKSFPNDERLQRPLFDLMGVRYVLATVPMRFAGTEVLAQVRGADSFYVYERQHALPRAFVVPAWRQLANEDEIVAALIAPNLDPRGEVLVTPDQAQALSEHAGAAGAQQRAVRFVADTANAVTLTVEAGPPGFLVMSDALMAGWTATVDDTPVPITRGNLFMRVVPLGSQALEVRLHFSTPSLPIGAGVSLLACLALTGLWFVRRRGHERTAPGFELEPPVLPQP